MKNRMKRIAMTAMAAAMVMGTTMPAFAATLDFSKEKNDGHSYEIYQIFKADVDAEKQLTNIKWGEDSAYAANGAEAGALVSDAILTELSGVDSAASNDTKLGTILNYYNAADTTPKYSLNLNTSESRTIEVEDGYYLIKDGADPTGDSYTTYMVKVAGGTVTIEPKSEKPGFEKKVLDEVGEDTEEASEVNNLTDKGGEWRESADHNINEVFQFRLTATLPDKAEMDDYEHYYMSFSDTLSKEVTYNNNMKVFVTAKDANGQTVTKQITSGYTLSGDTEAGAVRNADHSFKVEIMDLKKVLSDNGFSSSLAGVKVDVVYDAYLNESAAVSEAAPGDDSNINKAKLEYSNNPNNTGDGTSKPGDTDESEEDTVFVFTYDIDNFKVGNDEETALAGAEFQIKDAEGKAIQLKKVSAEDAAVDVYVPVKEGETGLDTITTTAGGKFVFKGLDAGEYTLVEVDAPQGYNKADDMNIVIQASHKEVDASNAEVVNLTKLKNGAAFTENKIINKRGSNLPETGGMGTTLLYTVGGLLVLGAGSVLVSRKRISK